MWLHGRAAEIAGPTLIADDLAEAIPQSACTGRMSELIVGSRHAVMA